MKKKIFFLLFVTLLIVPTVSAQTVNEGLPRFRIAVQGGYGCRLGKYTETGSGLEDKHVKRLRNGVVYGADLIWFTSSNYGFGLKFSDIHSMSEDFAKSMAYFIMVPVSGEWRTVLDLRFLGPTYSFRHVAKNNHWIFLISGGLGYLSYDKNDLLFNSPWSVKGGTLGFCVDAGVDLRLMDSLYLGASVNAIIGTLYTQEPHENLNHLSLNIGLRLYL